jgi:hypothetical protein
MCIAKSITLERRRLMQNAIRVFVSFAVMGGVTLAISVAAEAPHIVLGDDEMSIIIGGEPCTKCYDMCGGGGCQDSDCGNNDVGEFCGVALSSVAAAYDCIPSSSSEDDCFPDGEPWNCEQRVCTCHGKADCRKKSTSEQVEGKGICSD